MAHFAEIDTDNIVIRVLVVPDDQEHRGHEFLADDLDLGGTWVQTSYNTRGNVHYGEDGTPDGGTPTAFNYAGKGYTYDPDAGAFHASSPFPSWSLDENFVWQPPVPHPDTTVTIEIEGVEREIPAPYDWDEDTTSWVWDSEWMEEPT